MGIYVPPHIGLFCIFTKWHFPCSSPLFPRSHQEREIVSVSSQSTCGKRTTNKRNGRLPERNCCCLRPAGFPSRSARCWALSVIVAFYLYFLAGGIGVLAFEPTWLQNIAAYSPLTYGVHALQQAVFYSASDQLGRDVLVLGLSALAALLLGVVAMRRSIAS